MKFIDGSSQIKSEQGPFVVTIGNFDGLHIGHEALISRAHEMAHELGAKCLVLTFDPHPSEVLAPGHAVKRLYNIRRLEKVFDHLGVDVVVIEAFTQEFAQQPAKSFVRDYLVGELGAVGLVVGHDFRFGAGREGSFEKLKEWSDELQLRVDSVSAQITNEKIISSSLIRELISEGKVIEAQRYLGRPFSVFGKVIKGDGRGQKLGFPTANLKLDLPLDLASGVYAGEITIHEQSWPCVINYGQRPTFKSDTAVPSFEVHILDGEHDIYGDNVEVSLQHRIREELKFSSGDELIKQINQDIKKAFKLLKG